MAGEATPGARLAAAAFLTAPGAQAVFACLEGAGFEARAVGGAVRNALLGHAVADVDIATTAVPETVMDVARACGLHAYPTGIDHGTVTVVADHVPYEVTTLRKDVETHGRRAVVAYTTDWAEDAQRRDFTMNALYCDRNGVLHDPIDGYRDLEARRVRFIGDARARIEEDYLRILRYFRFFATYAQGPADQEALAAITFEREGLRLLSAERVRAELLKLMAQPRVGDALGDMARTGVLDVLFGPADWDERITRALRLRALWDAAVPEDALAIGERRDPALLMLAVVAGVGPRDADDFARRLRLSGDERGRIAAIGRVAAHPALEVRDTATLREAVYRNGRAAVIDALIWEAAGHATEASAAEAVSAGGADGIRRLVREAAEWPVPDFPIAGSDVLALGVRAGPRVGEILRSVEDWWIAAGFPDDAEAVRARLRAAAGQGRERP